MDAQIETLVDGRIPDYVPGERMVQEAGEYALAEYALALVEGNKVLVTVDVDENEILILDSIILQWVFGSSTDNLVQGWAILGRSDDAEAASAIPTNYDSYFSFWLPQIASKWDGTERSMPTDRMDILGKSRRLIFGPARVFFALNIDNLVGDATFSVLLTGRRIPRRLVPHLEPSGGSRLSDWPEVRDGVGRAVAPLAMARKGVEWDGSDTPYPSGVYLAQPGVLLNPLAPMADRGGGIVDPALVLGSWTVADVLPAVAVPPPPQTF